MKYLCISLMMIVLVLPVLAQQISWNTGIDAAIFHQQRAKNYFFKDKHYTRLSDTKADNGYPIPMPGGWKGLPTFWQSNIDAAVYHKSYDKVYFFKGNQYIRLTGVKVDPGYPRKMPGGWQGLPTSWHTGIDAALYYEPNGKLYFFRGNEYVRITGTTVDPGYPRTLPGGWRGLPATWYSGIDAAIFRKGHTYFFKGNEYVRFTGTKLDPGYPAYLPGGWEFQGGGGRSSAPSPRCQLIPESGNCKANFTKYYYDSRTGKCAPFTWGGCGGVVPFNTLQECQNACGG